MQWSREQHLHCSCSFFLESECHLLEVSFGNPLFLSFWYFVRHFLIYRFISIETGHQNHLGKFVNFECGFHLCHWFWYWGIFWLKKKNLFSPSLSWSTDWKIQTIGNENMETPKTLHIFWKNVRNHSSIFFFGTIMRDIAFSHLFLCFSGFVEW